MTLSDLLTICEEWNGLGWSPQHQLRDVVLDGEDVDDQNPEAMRLAVRFLKKAKSFCDDEELEADIDELLPTIAGFVAEKLGKV